MADILSLLSDRPIAYHRSLVKKYGLVAGVFLGQLLFWQGKGSKGQWVYKTQDEMKDETGLTRSNQETARKKLLAKGILEEKLVSIPARLHYRVNLTELAKSLGFSSLSESSKLDCRVSASSDVGIPQTNTENTQENTTEGGTAPPRPPAVDLIRSITGRYPPRRLWSALVNRLGAAPDKTKLEQVFTTWSMRGHNITNYDGILDWYEKGIPPPPGNRLPPNPNLPGRDKDGRAKLVI